MRDNEGGAALYECVDGLLHEVLRLGDVASSSNSALGGHGCEYLEAPLCRLEEEVVVVVD